MHLPSGFLDLGGSEERCYDEGESVFGDVTEEIEEGHEEEVEYEVEGEGHEDVV